MIKIDLSGTVTYLSEMDEFHFFKWAGAIKSINKIENGYFYVNSKNINKSDLRELIALMYRYKMRMSMLSVFCNKKNEHWFKVKGTYWYKPIFGK